VPLAKNTGVGQVFGRYFCRVFEIPSPKNAQKRDPKKETRKNRLRRFFVGSFVKCKTISTQLLSKTFFVVLLTPIAEKHPKTR
jgi:hypothetical protein